MQIDTHDIDGKKIGSTNLKDQLFNSKLDVSTVGSLVRWSESNQKPRRARTKNRSEVKGSTQKLGRQKGSGGARHGSKKANIFRSGGMAHNLRGVRSLKKMPKRIRQEAIKHILSDKLKNNNLIIVDELKIADPKTKTLAKCLSDLNAHSALILEGDKPDNNFALASRNLKNIKYTNINNFNALDLLGFEKLIISKNALELLESRVN
tara:strand:- start:944 stop:1564 length:621 start_codon:yes stop_codon:yes gene_type:complete